MEQSEKDQVIKDIEDKIKLSCNISKYKYLCNRISTANGLAWVVNRCIGMMSKEEMKLSAALAHLESELETGN
jgi:hypothetical protein